MIQKTTYNLVTLDLKMPHLDGFATLKEMGKLRSRPPVIVLTGFDDLRAAEECMRLGASDYITLPFQWETLLEAAHRALST
jgi:DNA-binding NtrC family response regulator